MNTPANSSRTGFTLIELLVVIAIIAILAGMLLPALSKSKDRAQLTVDLNNARQVLLATQIYVNDNQDFLPAPGWGLGVDSWLYEAGLPDAAGNSSAAMIDRQLDFMKGGPLSAQKRGGQLWQYLKQAKTYECPKDVADRASGLAKGLFDARSVKISSYVQNGVVSGLSSGVGGVTGKTYKMSQFKATNVLLWEPDEYTPFWFNDSSSFPDEGTSQRHSSGKNRTSSNRDVKGGAVVGMFGGTSQLMKFDKYYSQAGPIGARGAGVNPAPNDFWCMPGAARGGAQ
jgi:prepilin-type N-terminal cleavage/methylation domain-containing protein